MGREEAAIAVAIVSAKPAGHFRSSPGGYFHGMVAKAKAGRAEPGADDLGAARAGPEGRGGALAPPGELMAAPDFPPRWLCCGEGAPGGTAGGLADDTGGDQVPEQAEGRLRRDREVLRQAAPSDDRGAQRVLDHPRKL